MPIYSYIVELEGDQRRYKNSDKTLVVWGDRSCDQKIAQWAAANQLNADKFDELERWCANQPDEMHREWAHYCRLAIHRAYDRYQAQQQVNLAANVFPGSTPVLDLFT